MTLEQQRAKMKSAVWKGIGDSGVDVSVLPSEQQAKIVDSVADESLKMLNDLMSEAASVTGTKPAADDKETIIWEGRPFLSLVENYLITSERIKISRGLIGKDYDNYELIRIQDIDVSQALTERMFGLGDIHIRGADPTTPDVVLRNITNPNEVYELLRKAWLAARKKYGLIFRQEL